LTQNLIPTQALLLFSVLVRHGVSPQADLVPKVKKFDREDLAKKKLISVEKAGRGFQLTLSDLGWAWVAANLTAELPTPQLTLSLLLRRLDEHLKKTDETLADFIGQTPEKAPAVKSSDKVVKLRPRTGKAKPPTAKALRNRIETAYLELTKGRKNEAVRLALLRKQLSDLDRETVDSALGRILKGDKKASLLRHDDPHQLETEDHEAAFAPAGEPFHVIWISS
jgi:hypothetical protein